MWSYDPASMATRAILLTRTSKNADKNSSTLMSKMEHYKTLAGHPLFLAFVGYVDTAFFIDRLLLGQLDAVRIVEERTGFSYFKQHKPLVTFTTEEELADVSEMTKTVSSILVAMADVRQHIQYCQAALKAFTIDGQTWRAAIPKSSDSYIEMTSKDIYLASIALQPQLESTAQSTDYVRERARNQLTVVSNYYHMQCKFY